MCAIILALLLALGPAAAADQLPHSRVAKGDGPITRAWLSDPTGRYAHGVLGDALEAATLNVETTDGAHHRLTLPADAVFEDLTPRLIDLDGDGGTDAVLVVRSSLSQGAAPAIAQLGADGLTLTAAPPLGQANRWLNPVGAADFNGDGLVEIAVVETPHIGGTLPVYQWRDGTLRQLAVDRGYSNHAIDSTTLALHAIADLTGDARPEILVPGADRRTLKLVGLDGDRLVVHRTRDLAARVVGPVEVTPDGVRVPLADGSSVKVAR